MSFSLTLGLVDFLLGFNILAIDDDLLFFDLNNLLNSSCYFFIDLLEFLSKSSDLFISNLLGSFDLLDLLVISSCTLVGDNTGLWRWLLTDSWNWLFGWDLLSWLLELWSLLLILLATFFLLLFFFLLNGWIKWKWISWWFWRWSWLEFLWWSNTDGWLWYWLNGTWSWWLEWELGWKSWEWLQGSWFNFLWS